MPQTQSATSLFENELLDQFTAAFRAQKNLTAKTVQAYVHDIFGEATRCSTFRVRRVFSAEKAALRFQCHEGKTNAASILDLTMTVNNTGRIAGIENAGVTTDPY